MIECVRLRCQQRSKKRKKKKISFTVLYGISMGCISKRLLKGTHYLYVYNNDTGAAESRTPAQWHKAPETPQHKLTSISARNVHFKGSAEPYGASRAAGRECSITRRLYLQSAMPHPTAEVRARGNDCPHRYVWRLKCCLRGGGEAHARQQTLVDARRGTRLGARKTQTPFNARDTE